MISQVGKVTLFFMSDTFSNLSSRNHHLFFKMDSSSRTDVILILFLLYEKMMALRDLKTSSGSVFGVAWHFRGQMTPQLWLMYLEQGVCTSIVVMMILINITYQDTNTYIITKLPGRVLLMITFTRIIIHLNVYRKSLLKSPRIPLIKTMEVGMYPISLQHQKHHPSLQALACQPTVIQWKSNKDLQNFQWHLWSESHFF